MPLPLMEINQLVIIILIPIIIIKAKGRNAYFPNNLMFLIVIFLWVYIILQGTLMAYSYIDLVKVMKNYSLSFIFIMMVISLNWDEYKIILSRYTIFCNLFFTFEFLLGYFKLNTIYNLFFIPPYDQLRHMANFLSPNSYGILLTLLIISNIYLFFQNKKVTNIIFSIVLILPIISTVSKSTIILLLIGIVTFLFVKFKIAMKFVIITCLFVGLYYIMSDKILILLSKYASSYFVRRFILYFESGNLFGDRANEYNTIFNLYKDSWFTGLGFGNISGNNQLYSGMDSMHNEYLRFFIEGGIVGGILFSIIIVLLVYLIIKIISNRKIDSNDKALAVTFTIMFLIAEMQYNFFNAHREGIILIFFGFISIVLFKSQNHSEKLQSSNDDRTTESKYK